MKRLPFMGTILLLLLQGCGHSDWEVADGKYSFRNGNASLSLSDKNAIVLSVGNELVKEGQDISVKDNDTVAIVGLKEGQSITVNGLRIKSGKVVIETGIPRFVENGVIFVDNFAKRNGQFFSMELPVEVSHERNGALDRIAYVFKPEERLFADCELLGDVDSVDFRFLLDKEGNLSIQKLDAGNDPMFVLDTRGNFSALSQRVNPIGFRFIFAQAGNSSGYLGFVDDYMIKKFSGSGSNR
jgi:hypothetical protein